MEKQTMRFMTINGRQLVKPGLILPCLTAIMLVLQHAPAQTTVFNDTFGSGSTINSVSPSYPGANTTSYEALANKSISSGGISISANNLTFGSAASSSALAEVQALFTTTPVTLNQNGEYVQFTTTFTNVFALTTAYGAGILGFGMYNSGQQLPYPGGGNILAAAGPYTGYAQEWLGYVGVVKTNSTYFQLRPSQTGTAGRNQDLIAGAATSSGFQSGSTVGLTASTMGALTASVYTNVLTIMMNSDNTNSLAITNSLYDSTGTLLIQSGCVATNTTYVTNAFDSLAIGYYGAGPVGAVMHVSQITVTEYLAGSPGPLFSGTGGGTGCPGDSFVVGLSGSVTTNDYYLLTNGVANGSVVTGTGSVISFPAETVLSTTLTNTVMASNTVSGFTGLMIGSVLVAPSPSPIITTQPSSVVVTTNSAAVFVVVCSAGGLNYQWYRNGGALADGGNIAGSGTSTLVISPATTADAATTALGYYCVITNTCGFSATSTTNSLTLAAPSNIVWQGGNPSNIWDLATSLNFTNSAGTPVVFNNGDNVLLDDSSSYPAINVTGSYVEPTLIKDGASQNYFITAGSSAITGSGALLMTGSGNLTISNANTFTGGTTISNGTVTANTYNALGTGPLALAGGTFVIVPTGGTTSGLSNAVNVTENSTLQYNGANAYAGVIFSPLSGTVGKTLTINHTASGGEDRLRLYASFTNDASLALNDSSVWLAPYASGGVQVFNGVISGPGNIVNRANGITTFSGANTFSGECRLTTGTLGLGVNSTSSGGTVLTSPLGAGPLRLQNEGSSVGGNGAVQAVGGARVVENPIVYYRTNEFTFIINGTDDLTLAGNMDLHGQSDGLGGVNREIRVNNTGRSTLSGVISDNGTICGITKTGSGTLQLNGASSYTGSTVVSNGILAGIGSIVSPVTVASGGSIGAGTASIGTLTINQNLTLNGNGFFKLNKSLSPAQSNDLVSVSGALSGSGAGTITVTNLGPALAVGDSFKLFSAAVSGAGSMTISGGSVNWANHLADDGTITVLSIVSTVNPNAPQVQMSVTGNTLHLAWPTNAGWTLLTNSVGLTATSQWFPYPNSANLTNVDITINPATTNVFYRMAYPYP